MQRSYALYLTGCDALQLQRKIMGAAAQTLQTGSAVVTAGYNLDLTDPDDQLFYACITARDGSSTFTFKTTPTRNTMAKNQEAPDAFARCLKAAVNLASRGVGRLVALLIWARRQCSCLDWF
jgi:hypothetical protein